MGSWRVEFTAKQALKHETFCSWAHWKKSEIFQLTLLGVRIGPPNPHPLPHSERLRLCVFLAQKGDSFPRLYPLICETFQPTTMKNAGHGTCSACVLNLNQQRSLSRNSWRSLSLLWSYSSDRGACWCCGEGCNLRAKGAQGHQYLGPG